jgi:hypothetical protein
VPDISELERPQSTKPRAKPANVCHVIQAVKPAAYTNAETTSRRRRSNESAQAPEGTSNTNDVADHRMSSSEMCEALMPWSAKRSE